MIRHLFLLFFAMSAAPAVAASYTVASIPAPPGMTLTVVYGINNSGQVVGSVNNGTTSQAFIGTVSGSTAVPLPAGASSASGVAINNLGQVTGASSVGGHSLAYIGTASASTSIPLLPGQTISYGYGINDSGQVTGYTSNGSTPAGFVGTASASSAVAIPSGQMYAVSQAINASGQVTGYTTAGAQSTDLPFIGNTAQSSEVPSISGWTSVEADAINTAGQISGFGTNTNNKSQAFIGNSSGIAPIPLAAGATYGALNLQSINDSGVVVGISDAGAWIWDASAGTRLLNNLVPSGWTVSDALAINNNGQIVALASNGGVSSFVILMPVAPVSPCDVNQDGKINVNDVHDMVNQGLGAAAPANDLNASGGVNVVDIQIVANAAIDLGCTTGVVATGVIATGVVATFAFNQPNRSLQMRGRGLNDASTIAAPTVLAVVNAASLQSGPVSPGEIVAIEGVGLGAPVSSIQSGLNESFDGVQVLFGGTSARLRYGSAGRIVCVVPYDVQGEPKIILQVRYRGQFSGPFPLRVVAANPALFSANGIGTGPAAALNQDLSSNSSGNPAARGSVVSVFVTGQGKTSPAGSPWLAPILQPRRPVSVSIGGRRAVIVSYGEADGVEGAMQVRVRIPSDLPPGNLPLVVSVGGARSQNDVTLSVE